MLDVKYVIVHTFFNVDYSNFDDINERTYIVSTDDYVCV